MSLKITEVQGDDALSIGRIPMTCKEDDLKVPEPLQRNCFFYMMVGTPGSGKSNLVYSLISKRGFAYYRKFEMVVIFSASLHTLDKKLGLPPEQLIAGFDEYQLMGVLDRINTENKRALLIFDDVVASIKRGQMAFQRLVWNRRHQGKGISIMLVTQRMSAVPLELRSSVTGLFFFHTKNQTELEILRKEWMGGTREEFEQILKAVWKKKFDFLYMNLSGGEDKMIHRNFNLLVVEKSEESHQTEDVVDGFDRALESIAR